MTDATDIAAEVERFIARTGLPVTSFGRQAVGDANLVANLRAGRELRRATEARVRTFMASYRPSDARGCIAA
jgi:2,4-dienoyl-CoA reductase-like NADH-dependent reductase (Old Yellow Enzyme family)